MSGSLRIPALNILRLAIECSTRTFPSARSAIRN
jgi:hypothetical protein